MPSSQNVSLVESNGIQIDPKKIEAIIDWARPITVTEVKSFFWVVGYYRRIIKEFSKIAAPLTRLTPKNIKFIWTDKCEHFQSLKDLLTSALVLPLPLGDE